jgi:hypothetical protein
MLEAEKFNVRLQIDFVSSLQVATFSLSSHVVFPQYMNMERKSELSGICSYKDTNPIRIGRIIRIMTTFKFNYLLKGLSYWV